MGVAGLAWATFIAQGIAAILCIFRLFHAIKKLTFEGTAKFFSKVLLVQMCVVAIPSVLQQSFVSVGNLFIQGLVNSYGSQVIAGYTSAIKLNTFVITTLTTVAGSLSSFAANGQKTRYQRNYQQVNMNQPQYSGESFYNVGVRPLNPGEVRTYYATKFHRKFIIFALCIGLCADLFWVFTLFRLMSTYKPNKGDITEAVF